MQMGEMQENNWAGIWKESNRHRKKGNQVMQNVFVWPGWDLIKWYVRGEDAGE